jgi:hypothetical protein
MNTFKLVVVLTVLSNSQILFAENPITSAQEDSTCNLSFSFNADMVSRYIWRGLPQNLSPNIQPYASLGYKDFTFGAWGSYGLSSAYAEMDLYLSYTAGLFTVCVNDYYNEDESDLDINDYFNWKNTDTSSTPHALEGALAFNGTDALPLSITAATYFYGNDKDSATNKNQYSTYLEIAYSTSIRNNDIKLFIGGTISNGSYATKAAIVNLGFTATRELKFSDSYSLPVSASLILNPYANNVFFVFGITF